MITHFYKVPRLGYSRPTLVCTKNIDIIPVKDTYVEWNNIKYRVENVLFNLEKCEYQIIMVRI